MNFTETLNNKEAKRKLASIQKVINITPIPGSDFIELAQIQGWSSIIKKGEFSIGDLAVYFEIDSFLPERKEFEFLRKSSWKQNSQNGSGFRIKTMKMRNTLSQGLLLKPELFAELPQNLNVGDDVTDLLKIKKYYTPEVSAGTLGMSDGPFPTHLTEKTDELRLQSNPEFIDKMKNIPYYVAVKYDGTSITIIKNNNEISVNSRNLSLKKENSVIWDLLEEKSVLDKLESYPDNIVIKGELYGEGIQSNPLKIKGKNIAIFTIEKDGLQVGLNELLTISNYFGLDTVDVEEVGGATDFEKDLITNYFPNIKFTELFSETIDSLLNKAKGFYPSGNVREGIVIRPLFSQDLSKDVISFKVINNDFLLKEK